MTAPRRDGKHASEFAEWVRANPELDPRAVGLSIADIDWVVHQFRTRPDGRAVQNLMFVEEKTNGAGFRTRYNEPTPQCDTFHALAYLFKQLPQKRTPFRYPAKSPIAHGWVKIRWWGFHWMQFSGDGPLSSSLIRWDGKEIDIKILAELLRFARNPYTLKPLDETERDHHNNPRQLKWWFGKFGNV